MNNSNKETMPNLWIHLKTNLNPQQSSPTNSQTVSNLNYPNLLNNQKSNDCLSSLVNLKSCIFQTLQDNFFELIQGNLSISICVHHLHVRSHILFAWSVILPHFPVCFLNNVRNLVFSELSVSIFVKHLEQSSSHVQSFPSYQR